MGATSALLLCVIGVAALGMDTVNAFTSQTDLNALYIIKDEVYNRDEHWRAVVDKWSGGGPNGEDDPCGLDWRGNWEGVECRGQDGKPWEEERFVTNIHITDSAVGGPIPLGMSLLHNLIEFDMDGNRLTGPLIPQIACLPNVGELDLANNSIWGPIPTAWRGLEKLEEAELEKNPELSGCIPQGMPPVTTVCPEELPYCELIGTLTDQTAVWGFCEDYPEVNLWCPTPEEVKEFINNGNNYDSLVDQASMSTTPQPVGFTGNAGPITADATTSEVAAAPPPRGIIGRLFDGVFG
ncbi:unnamed protein product [Ostreobium quekettii]|uniref:Uncharacterized protein n=1 Tax=Ostreobium quekettii TaxID=121088 RepID=A0A8S1J5C9_9CHLO|nr:unnamed protein product [Ostreobium quekettii]|eukprot:evm.model.scf_385.7 EVM.evm.TU.scf_385.7   scf_385:47593-50247(-)